jgi:hypothetical protein
MPDHDPRPDEVARVDRESAEAASADSELAPPAVTAERIGKEAVLLRFNLTDGTLDLSDDEADDEERLGGDAACWAHLFADRPNDEPEEADR